MSPFCRRQMAMNSVSWCLFWDKRHEFDHFLKFQADLIRHVAGWLTQEAEEFKRTCDAVYVDMNSKTRKSSISMSARIFRNFSGIPRRRICSMNLVQ